MKCSLFKAEVIVLSQVHSFNQFFSRISKRLRKKDCMMLSALGKKYTESTHSKGGDKSHRICLRHKQWLEPYLNNVKNHVYPHSYKFFKKNGKVEMKYKAWARDEKWIPEGNSLHILNGIPEETPSLVRLDDRKLLEVKQLEDLVSKCKRMSAKDRQWWNSFTTNEKHYQRKWEAAS